MRKNSPATITNTATAKKSSQRRTSMIRSVVLATDSIGTVQPLCPRPRTKGETALESAA
jgi:hypothetical protein